MSLETVQEQMMEIVSMYPSGVVVIANIGVWYNSRERFRRELPLFLKWLSDLGKDPDNLIMYRETAAQHWNHTGK